MKKELFFLILLLIIPSVMAKEGNMVLLAVKESSDGYVGSVANLYLEIKEGQGRVFIETFPVAKMDTQISTRFAKDIACDFLDKDCDRYDFFYTIKADSAIIGGPSAGGATAVLTAIVLSDLEVNGDTAMTGTINSGGLIGPVSGLKAKIDAAAEVNLSTVLIPRGERFVKEDENLTTDLKEYGNNKSIEVIQVGDLTEAMHYFTGKRFKEDDKELIVNKDYARIMKSLAVDLCNRSRVLHKEVYDSNASIGVVDEDFAELDEKAINFSDKGEKAFNEGRYYTAASYCFGANIHNRDMLIRVENFTNFSKVEADIDKFEEKIKKFEIKTITDLEAYMAVDERIKDARDLLNKSKENFEKKEEYKSLLARAIERLYSAESWSWFFGMESKEFEFDKESLEEGCASKLSEAEERYQYARLFFPSSLVETKKELDLAYEDMENGDYELCLFKASKIKAEADVILGVIGVDEEQIENVFDNKLVIVKRVIVEQEDIFPILGYSYYEYADSLKEDDIYSALLYSEYALELSNLDMYFKEKKYFKDIRINKDVLLVLGGIVIGVFLYSFVRKKKVKRKRKK